MRFSDPTGRRKPGRIRRRQHLLQYGRRARSKWRANRRSLLENLAAEGLAAWAELNQVHGDTLVFEPDAVSWEAQPTADGDGLATSRPGLGLLIKTADCQPVLLAHRAAAT